MLCSDNRSSAFSRLSFASHHDMRRAAGLPEVSSDVHASSGSHNFQNSNSDLPDHSFRMGDPISREPSKTNPKNSRVGSSNTVVPEYGTLSCLLWIWTRFQILQGQKKTNPNLQEEIPHILAH